MQHFFAKLVSVPKATNLAFHLVAALEMWLPQHFIASNVSQPLASVKDGEQIVQMVQLVEDRYRDFVWHQMKHPCAGLPCTDAEMWFFFVIYLNYSLAFCQVFMHS